MKRWLIACLMLWLVPSLEVRAEKASEPWLEYAYKAHRRGASEVATRRLEDGFAKYMAATPKDFGLAKAFDGWNYEVWQDAHFGRGARDLAWSHLIWQWIYDNAKRSDRWDWACHVRSNLALSLLGMGRQARCRHLLFEHEDYLLGQGFSHRTADFSAKGVWFAPLHDVMLRDFPLTIPNGRHVVYWQRPEAKNDPGKRILIDNVGIGNLMLVRAMEWNTGDWRGAMEKNLWVLAWAREVHRQMEDPAVKAKPKREHGDKHDDAMGDLLGSLEFLGFHERVIELADEALASSWKSEYDGIPRTRIRILRELARVSLGQADRTSVEVLERESVRLRKSKFFDIRLDAELKLALAKLLVAAGREDESEALLASVRREVCGEFWWRQIGLFRLERDIRRGRIEGLEPRLAEILGEVRKDQAKISEIQVLMLYSDFCLAAGRAMEGLMAEREVLRLIRAFDLYPLEPRCLARIAVLQVRAGDPEGAAKVAAQARGLVGERKVGSGMAEAVKRLLDQVGTGAARVAVEPRQKSGPILQPRIAASMAIGRRAAKAMFSLSNASPGPVAGTLRFGPHPVKITWDEAAATGTVEVLPEGSPPPTAAEQEVRLAAGEVATFQTLLPAGFGDTGRLDLEWNEAGRRADEAVWKFDPAEQGVDYAVIDVGQYEASPFHLVPIHHHLQMKPGGRANLRVLASPPARVELYDERGAFAMVDAEGNGSLADAGDQLAWDADRDGWPEIVPDGEGEAHIRIHAHCLGAIPPEGLELRVQWHEDGAWQDVAKDKIMPPK